MGTVGKALSLLDTLSQMGGEPGLTDIARASALDKATARRLLLELEAYGFVEQDSFTRGYRLGPAPIRLARIRETRYPFIQIAIPHLKALAERTGETVHLSRFAAGTLSTVHVEESQYANRVSVEVGIRLPFHTTASGLAFLAQCPTVDIQTYLDFPLTAYTSHTVTDRDALMAAIAMARSRGYSVVQDGFDVGVMSAGAAIAGPGALPIGTVAVAAPEARTDLEKLKEFGGMAAETAGAIARAFWGIQKKTGA
jgi:DNA-binding IclR family transcriptional regulator